MPVLKYDDDFEGSQYELRPGKASSGSRPRISYIRHKATKSPLMIDFSVLPTNTVRLNVLAPYEDSRPEDMSRTMKMIGSGEEQKARIRLVQQIQEWVRDTICKNPTQYFNGSNVKPAQIENGLSSCITGADEYDNPAISTKFRGNTVVRKVMEIVDGRVGLHSVVKADGTEEPVLGTVDDIMHSSSSCMMASVSVWCGAGGKNGVTFNATVVHNMNDAGSGSGNSASPAVGFAFEEDEGSA